MLLVLLAAAAGGLVVLDGVARRAAQTAVADGARQELGLPRAPVVRIGGTSFLWQALRGRYDDVAVWAPAVTQQGATLQDVRVHSSDVTAPRSVLTGGGGTVRVGGGTASAVLPWAQVADRASAATGLRLRLDAAGRDVRARTTVHVLGQALPVTVTLSLALDGGRAVLQPRAATVAGRSLPVAALRRTLRAVGQDRLAGPVRVPLSGLPPQVRPTALRAAAGGVVVDADLVPAVVQVPPASSTAASGTPGRQLSAISR